MSYVWGYFGENMVTLITRMVSMEIARRVILFIENFMVKLV